MWHHMCSTKIKSDSKKDFLNLWTIHNMQIILNKLNDLLPGWLFIPCTKQFQRCGFIRIQWLQTGSKLVISLVESLITTWNSFVSSKHAILPFLNHIFETSHNPYLVIACSRNESMWLYSLSKATRLVSKQSPFLKENFTAWFHWRIQFENFKTDALTMIFAVCLFISFASKVAVYGTTLLINVIAPQMEFITKTDRD